MARSRERKPHWLGRTNGGEMPVRLTYVGISSELVHQSEDKKISIESGRMVATETVSYATGTGVSVDHLTCGSTADFWSFLARGLRRRQMNWVYMRDMSRAMTLLHGWELIEEGGIQYQAACLQDPPIWIRCAIAGKSVMLCDSRNYGDDARSAIYTEQQEEAACAERGISIVRYWSECAAAECVSIRLAVEPVYQSIQSMGGCGWKPTISGMAWSLYRRHFIPEVDWWQDEEDAQNSVE